jgi:ankyrin repeat protein
MLYLTGKMGCGKSVLTKFLLNTLEERVSDSSVESDKSAVLYYFCSSVTRPEESASSLVRGLIHQFLSNRKSLYPSLIETCRDLLGSQSSRDLDKWSLRALWDVFVSLLCCSGHEIIWLVIDAMDECQETETETFLTLLLSLLEPGAIKEKTLKIFLTSRPYDSISRTLYRDHIKKIHIHREMVLPDIEKVLSKQLEDIQRQFSLSSTEIQELKGRLAQKSDGMFMWAVLAMKELGRSALFATFGSLEDLINDLPQGLTELYDKAWLKLDRSHNENVDLARKILIWILLAARPLTLSELIMVLAMRPSKTNETSRLPLESEFYRDVAHIVLHFFAPFVEIVFRQSRDDPSSDVRVSTVEALRNFGPINDSIATVRLVHQSAQAYLLQKSTEHFSGQLPGKVSFSKEDGHELIARTCIAYLECKELKLEWIGPRRHDDKGFLEADDSTRDLIRKKLHQYVLLEYSSLYWSLHVRRSQVAEKKEQATQHDFQDDISSHALDFLCNYRKALECVFQVFGLTRNPERKSFWPCYSPLHDAAFLDCLAVVQRLLNIENVDINSRDSVGSTPLMHVCMGIVQDDDLDSRVQIARLLIERNADPTVQDNFGKTGLHYAVSEGAQMTRPVVVQMLLEKGADVAAKDEDGATVLLLAAENGHEAVIRLLLEKGTDVAAKNESGTTALHLAAENGHETIIRLLLEQKDVDPESKNKYGWTALYWAAQNRHEAIVKLLLEKGTDIAVKDDSG